MKRRQAKKRRKQRARTDRPAPDLQGLDFGGDRRRIDYRNMLIVAAVALSVRILFFFLYKHNNPMFYHPIMDAKYHHEWALEIVSGSFWGSEVFFRAPLYPYLLALLYKVSGNSIAFAIAVQQLMGVCTTLLVYILARQFFVPTIALLSGVIAALYWPFLYFEGDLLIVTLILLLDVAALLLLVRSMRSGRSSLLFGSGIVLGLSAIARPSILIFFPVVALAFYLNRGKQESRKRVPSWFSHSLLVYLGALVIITPVLVRNYVVGRDVVPIASQGGVNFFIGNNPESDGRTAIVPGTRWDWWGGYEDAIAIAERDRGGPLKPSEVSNYYFKKAFTFIFTSPGESLSLMARKFAIFWAGGERSNNKYIYFFWHKSGLGKVPLPGFWFVTPLALFGAIVLWPRRRDFALLYLFVVSYMLGVIVFFVNARFRLPVVPVLIIFAGYALFAIWQATRTRTHRLKLLLLVVVCFVAVDMDFLTFRENKVYADSLSHYTLGNAYLSMGLSNKAIDEYEEAIAVYEQYPNTGYRLVARNVNFNLGKLYHDKGLCSRALPLLARVGGDDQFATIAERYLGECLVSLGRYEEAVNTFDAILRGHPEDIDARRGMVQALIGWANRLAQGDDRANALAVLERARSLSPSDPQIQREIERIQSER